MNNPMMIDNAESSLKLSEPAQDQLAQLVNDINSSGLSLIQMRNNQAQTPEEREKCFRQYCDNVLEKVITSMATKDNGKQIATLKLVADKILAQIEHTKEGWQQEPSEKTLYSASKDIFSLLLDKLSSWHEFNADFRQRQHSLQGDIDKTISHFKNLRESKRSEQTIKFIQQA